MRSRPVEQFPPLPPSRPDRSAAGILERPWTTTLCAVLLAAALLGAYHNTFQVPFLLDDEDSIARNPSVRSFATSLFPPADSGITVSGRPLLNFTLAINHRLGGTAVAGYHAGNLLIHFAATLCLVGVVRRTLRLPTIAETFRAHAAPLAWFAGSLWALHPLQTESVTYIIQRAESLVGLCYLFTLYSFVRAITGGSRAWAIAAFAGCYLGMAAKEVMVTAPVVLLLYDRTFVSNSFREAWRSNRSLYIGLASGWLLLVVLLIASGGRGSTVGYASVTWLEYALMQGPGVVTYLFKSIVPTGLVFDYGAIVEKRTGVLAVGVLAALALLALTIALVVRRPRAGFLGAWFFMILAPTSSVVPVATQTLAEHRMYLPLAAVTTTAVLLAHRIGARWSRGVLILLVFAAAAGTATRNHDYRTAIAIWEDTVRKVPDNGRARVNLGGSLLAAGRIDEALVHLTKAVELIPLSASANANLGQALVRKSLGAEDANRASGSLPDPFTAAPRAPESGGDAELVARGLALLDRAVELEPSNPRLLGMKGNALLDAGRIEASWPVFSRAVDLEPDDVFNRFNLANVLMRLGRDAEAERHYLIALREAPDDPEVRTNHGILLRRLGRLSEAIDQLRLAAASSPGSARVHSNLGVAYLANGRTDEGIAALETALRLDPRMPQAHYHLANTLERLGRTGDAIAHFETLLTLIPPTAELLSNLGVLHAREGRIEQALALTRQALSMDPAHEASQENLAILDALLRSQTGR